MSNRIQWEYLMEADDRVFGKGIKMSESTYYPEQRFESPNHYLQERGKDGWELVQAPTHQMSTYYFKRQKQ